MASPPKQPSKAKRYNLKFIKEKFESSGQKTSKLRIFVEISIFQLKFQNLLNIPKTITLKDWNLSEKKSL